MSALKFMEEIFPLKKLGYCKDPEKEGPQTSEWASARSPFAVPTSQRDPGSSPSEVALGPQGLQDHKP